jgi:hypothetical protein
MLSWQPFDLKQCMNYVLPHYNNLWKQSVNNYWSCTFGNQNLSRIHELITGLFTVFLGKNSEYKWKYTHSKIFNITNCKSLQNDIIDCNIGDFVNILLSNWIMRTSKWIQRWTHWATCRKPTVSHWVWIPPLDCPGIADSRELTTGTRNWALIQLKPRHWPKATVQPCCKY